MSLLSNLTEALLCLPGVGPKSSQRMVYYLLQHKRSKATHLAYILKEAMSKIKNCVRCNNFTETELCNICEDPKRLNSTLCIVDSPADIQAIEQCNFFRGKYFVLFGKISPIDGLGPDEIGLPRLEEIVKENQPTEIILALNPGVDTQTTTYFINQYLSKYSLKITQLAHGIPASGELEYLDGSTILNALTNRNSI